MEWQHAQEQQNGRCQNFFDAYAWNKTIVQKYFLDPQVPFILIKCQVIPAFGALHDLKGIGNNKIIHANYRMAELGQIIYLVSVNCEVAICIHASWINELEISAT